MTFLNPLVLIGLLAASIPIILHLLNLRKLRTIEFSTIDFLKELQKSTMRRIKVRQWLLLVLRTFLVILVVLAFARPAMKGTMAGTIGTHAHSSVVILLDDSFSLSISDEHGQRWKRAKDAALRIVDLLQEGDEAFLVPWSKTVQSLQDHATHDFYALRARITNADLSYERTSLDKVLGTASKLLSSVQNANKEVYIISDFQETVVENRPEKEMRESLFDNNVRLFTLRVGDRSLDNAGVTSVELMSSIFMKERPVRLRATVKNFGSNAISNTLVSAFLDGNRVVERGVTLQAGEQTTIDLSVVPHRTGILPGMIQLEDDLMEPDNVRYFTVSVPRRIDALLLASTPQESRFIRAVLEAAGREQNGLFHMVQVSPHDLPTTNIGSFDVIVAAGVDEISMSDLTRLKQFLESSGGILFFPAGSMDLAGYRNSWEASLGLPHIASINGNASDRSTFRSFESIDFEHPLFEGVFEPGDKQNRKKTIDSPRIYASVFYQMDPRMRTIITLSDGSPFLIAQQVGSGILLLFSVPPTLEWSDLPLKAVFVPLISRSLLLAAAQGSKETHGLVGIPVTIRMPGRELPAEASALTLRKPDGIENFVRPLLPTFPGGDATVSIENDDVPGIYELYARQNHLRSFAVNVDPLESDLQLGETETLDSLWSRYGISSTALRKLDPMENLETAILQSRFGIELWKYAIGLALVIALTEMFIAREKKEGPGPPRGSE